MIGFYTFANLMTERQLSNSAPKPVSMFDSRIHLRFDLDHPPGRVPQHFTNIHAGLRLARSVLARQPAANKQIIVITDGEPTAHIEGREVVLIYPPAEKTATHTLAEVRELRQRRHPRLELRPDRGLLLPRPGQLRRGDGQGLARAWPLIARPTRSATSSSRASSAGGARGGSAADRGGRAAETISSFGVVQQLLQSVREGRRQAGEPGLVHEADIDHIEEVDLVLPPKEVSFILINDSRVTTRKVAVGSDSFHLGGGHAVVGRGPFRQQRGHGRHPGPWLLARPGTCRFL